MQRACEVAIDLAMHIVSVENLGVPQASRDAFEILHKHQWIDVQLMNKMKAMVGFRNIAVHDYQTIQIPILKKMITHHLDDFELFITHIVKKSSNQTRPD